MSYAVTDLLTDIRREAMLPATTANGTADADLLASAQYEIETRLTPLILSTREEYLIVQKYISMVANQSQYRFPRRAVAGRLRDVCLKRGDGSLKQLQRIELEQARRMYTPNTSGGEPEAFAVRGEYLILYPTPSNATYKIRLEVPVRPARMTTSSCSAQYFPGTLATAAPTADGSKTITWDMLGSTGVFGASNSIDLVRGDNGFTPWAVDVRMNSCPNDGAGTYSPVIWISELPDEYGAFFSEVSNDHSIFCLANATPNIPLPVELHGVLIQYTCARIKRQLGELEQATFYESVAQRMEKDALRTLTPRIEGPPRKVVGGVLWKQRGPWWLGVR